MSLLLPALVLVGAVVTSYLFCVRPMRRGTCAMSAIARPRRPSLDDQVPVSPVSDAELAQVRQGVGPAARAGRIDCLDRALIPP